MHRTNAQVAGQLESARIGAGATIQAAGLRGLGGAVRGQLTQEQRFEALGKLRGDPQLQSAALAAMAQATGVPLRQIPKPNEPAYAQYAATLQRLAEIALDRDISRTPTVQGIAQGPAGTAPANPGFSVVNVH